MQPPDTQFKPGHPPHPRAGRPRGSLNRRNQAVNDALADVVLAEMPQLRQAMAIMLKRDSGAYIALLAKLLPNLLPRAGWAMGEADAPPPPAPSTGTDEAPTDPTDTIPPPLSPPDSLFKGEV